MDMKENQPRFRTYFVLAVGFVGLALVSLLIDIPVAKSFRDKMIPGDLRKLLTLSEVFAHGLGVTAVLMAVWAVAVDQRRKLLRVACCAIIPGTIVSLSKVLVARHRPHSFTELPDRVSATFEGILPALQRHNWAATFDSDLQSMPSGHSATAVGLAIGLSWLFPKGKWCFVGFAALAICQRLDSGAHFPSDTFIGAAVACLIAGRYLTTGWESRLFRRFENRPTFLADDGEFRQTA